MPPAASSLVRARAGTRVTFACYLVVLGYLVFTPQPDDHRAFGWVRRSIDWVAAHGVPLTFPVAEAAGNVLLFVQFGLLLGALLGLRRWWLVWLAGSVTSAATPARPFLACMATVSSPPRPVTRKTDHMV